MSRTKDAEVVHIIAKLCTTEYPLLPQVEELSMRMAAVACVNVCDVELPPGDIEADQPLVRGEGRQFLPVRRVDRARTRHMHCEDFAQIPGAAPAEKYQNP